MSGVRAALVGLGVAAGHISSELFGALAPINPGVVTGHVVAPHPPAGPPGDGPVVTFARSGLNVTSSAGRDGSLLEL